LVPKQTLSTLYSQQLPTMSNIKQHQVLEFISAKIKNAIADAKLEKQSQVLSIIKDGNDTIQLEYAAEGARKHSILITDQREILYSEDLLEDLQDLHLETMPDDPLYNELKVTSVVVNGLSVETEFVFQAVKDCFDTLSESYQFNKITAKNVNSLNMDFNFGDNKFKIVVTNDTDAISITANVDGAANDKVKKTIEGDVEKVQQALNKMFKAD